MHLNRYKLRLYFCVGKHGKYNTLVNYNIYPVYFLGGVSMIGGGGRG